MGGDSNWDTCKIQEILLELHKYYLKNNLYDEGDPIFHRINYKLMDRFRMTAADAVEFHRRYHNDNPRRVSEGYCDSCRKIITIIPIIYDLSQREELANLILAEKDERLIIGNVDDIKEGNKVAMFGCKICKTPLPQYGII